jgi:hypothetical protein
MQILGLIAYVFALVLFVIAGWSWAATSPNYYRLLAMGLAFLAAGLILSGAGEAHLALR